MKKMYSILVLITFLATALLPPFTRADISVDLPDLIVHVGTLIAVPGSRAENERTLFVTDGRITDIREGFVDVENVDRLDLSDMYVLPGLIDCHTHLTMYIDGSFFMSILTDRPAYTALRSVDYAKRTLEAGFTTVRDVGGFEGIDLSLKRAIEEGRIIGPRMFVSSKDLSISGGHGDMHIGVREDYAPPGKVSQGIVNGVDSAIAATRLMIRRGADHIKLSVSGGVLSLTSDSSSPQFTREELEAVVSTATDFGRKVAAHAHGDEGARRAIEAGVASIEHGTYLSDDTFEMMKERSVFLVPTISAGKTIERVALDGETYPAAMAAKALEVGPLMQSAFARAHEAGVPIAFGTDAGVFAHGENAQEFIYMTEAGMSPVDAIRSATVNAAQLIGSDEIGVLRVGGFADFIAVGADPRKDVAQLTDVHVVVKGGVLYKGSQFVTPSGD